MRCTVERTSEARHSPHGQSGRLLGRIRDWRVRIDSHVVHVQRPPSCRALYTSHPAEPAELVVVKPLYSLPDAAEPEWINAKRSLVLLETSASLRAGVSH